MTAIRHVLRDVAEDRYVVPASVVQGLALALDAALRRYAETATADRKEHG